MKLAKEILVYIAILFMNLSCSSNSHISSIRYSDSQVRESGALRNAKYKIKEIVRDASYSDQAPYLKYDLFMPSDWTGSELPRLLILAHPGGFILGDKSDYLIQRMCKDLARLGFATAAINYRLINPVSEVRDLTVNGRRQTLVKSILDARLAIKVIQDRHGFSPKQTYFLGYSAGGIIGNHILFSSKEELIGFAHPSNLSDDIYIPAERLVNGVISIAGGILDFSHIDDEDMSNTQLLLIHGTQDRVVPFKWGKPFDKMVEEDIEIEVPGLYYELGGSLNEDDFRIRFEPGIQIQSVFLKLIRDQLYPDEICGSGCIYEDQRHQKGKIQLVRVEKGPHSFMHNNKDGQLNSTYIATIRTIQHYLEEVDPSRKRRRQR